MDDLKAKEQIASKLHTIFVPYIEILEIKEKPNSKLPKKILNLMTYVKIKKILTK